MSRVWVGIKRIWRFLGILVGLIVFAVCVFMIWRVSSTGTPKELEALSKNDKLSAAYSESGEELYMFKQNQDIITRADYNAGYFSIPDYCFIPDANQLQLVFRYNNSTLKALATDKKLDSVPDREGDYFDVSLVLYIDLTPDNDEDNGDTNSPNIKKIRCKASDVKKGKSTLYNFYRYTFDFEDCDEPLEIKELLDSGTVIAIHAQFYYNEELNYDESPYGALLLYDPDMKNIRVKLSSADKKSLEG